MSTSTSLLLLSLLPLLHPSSASGGGGDGYCTYHMYSATDSLGTTACSDGRNGLQTTFGITDLSSLYPYVTAMEGVRWNHPKCGDCVCFKEGNQHPRPRAT